MTGGDTDRCGKNNCAKFCTVEWYGWEIISYPISGRDAGAGGDTAAGDTVILFVR